jgi:hypothetical protein
MCGIRSKFTPVSLCFCQIAEALTDRCYPDRRPCCKLGDAISATYIKISGIVLLHVVPGRQKNTSRYNLYPSLISVYVFLYLVQIVHREVDLIQQGWKTLSL